MFHIFCLVCFLIYGVNSSFLSSKTDYVVFKEKSGVFLEGFALTWSFWDMLDVSMFRLLVNFHVSDPKLSF